MTSATWFKRAASVRDAPLGRLRGHRHASAGLRCTIAEAPTPISACKAPHSSAQRSACEGASERLVVLERP